MTINRPNNSNYCNTSKCITCNFRFVCASSPYCCVKFDSSNSVGNSEVIENLSNRIEELEKFITGFVNSQASIVSGVLEEFKNINSNIDSINNAISESSKIISEKIEFTKDNITSENSSQIVPFPNETEDKNVLVEKKGMFGRTKWVEKKK